MIDADFSSMSIVFKNLIDNALKHSGDLEIEVTDKEILFISSGKVLDERLHYYTEAFIKGKSMDGEKGFGLGLYIVNEIINQHHMTFSYIHKFDKNMFIIRY
jgi:two-component system OmpR family sensor kinase